MYLSLIAALLIMLLLGRAPRKPEIIHFYLSGWASLGELCAKLKINTCTGVAAPPVPPCNKTLQPPFVRFQRPQQLPCRTLLGSDINTAHRHSCFGYRPASWDFTVG